MSGVKRLLYAVACPWRLKRHLSPDTALEKASLLQESPPSPGCFLLTHRAEVVQLIVQCGEEPVPGVADEAVGGIERLEGELEGVRVRALDVTNAAVRVALHHGIGRGQCGDGESAILEPNQSRDSPRRPLVARKPDQEGLVVHGGLPSPKGALAEHGQQRVELARRGTWPAPVNVTYLRQRLNGKSGASTGGPPPAPTVFPGSFSCSRLPLVPHSSRL